eukprot:9335068-Karenia_brevis.AAC.1
MMRTRCILCFPRHVSNTGSNFPPRTIINNAWRQASIDRKMKRYRQMPRQGVLPNTTNYNVHGNKEK